MFRKFFYCFLVILFLFSCGSSAKTSPDVAITLDEAIVKTAADIMKKVPSSTIIALFNISESDYSVVTEYVIEELSAVLVDKAKITVVDRNNMNVIDAEHSFQISGRVSDEQIISMAKKLGATAVISCSVSGQFDLRRLRIRALEVETGKVLSLTSHSIKNITDYAKPQAVIPRDNATHTVAVDPPVQSVAVVSVTPISLNGNDWYKNTISSDRIHQYRFLAGNYQSYFIEWNDYDTNGRSYANVEVGIQRDEDYIVVPVNNGNYSLNKHRIQTTQNIFYTIVVKSVDSGDYQIRIYPEIIFKIGERGPGGGIIFYDKVSFSDGWRYLEAAPASTEIRNSQWGAYNQDIRGTQMILGSGQMNTLIIDKYLRELNQSGKAAQLCKQLNSGGFTDWFLPSREELHWMYLNLHREGIGGFKNERYWSSSQVDTKRAWYLNFGDKGRASHNKDKDGDGWVFRYDIYTRAIRAF